MAINIPVYTPKAQEAGLPGYRQNLKDQVSDAIGGVGEGIIRATKGISDVMDEQNAAADMVAFSQLGAATQTVLEDKGAGFLNYQGQEAGARRDAAVGQFDARVKEIEGSLTNGRQRTAFQAKAISARARFLSIVDGHVVKQADAYTEQAYEGAVSTASSEAVGAAARGDFDVTRQALANLDGIIDRRAGVKKWAPDFTATQRRLAQTGAHLRILDGMLEAGRSTDAAEYLRTLQSMPSGDLDGDMLAKSNIEAKVGAASLRQASFSEASAAWREARSPAVPEGQRRKRVSVEEAYQSALSIVDQAGGSREQILERRESLKKLYLADKEASRAANEQRMGRLGEVLYNGGMFTNLHPDYVALDDDDAKRDASKMRLAEQRDRKLLGVRLRDEQRQIDLDLEAQWHALEPSGDQANDQMSVDLFSGDFANLSNRKRNEIIAKRRGVGKAIAKDGGVTIQAHKARVDEMLVKRGVTGKDTGAKVKALIETDYYRAKEASKDGIVSPEVEQEIIERRFKQGVIENWLYSRDTTAVEAEIKGKADRFKAANDEAEKATDPLRSKDIQNEPSRPAVLPGEEKKPKAKAKKPTPRGPKPGDRVSGETLGQPAGTEFEYQANGKYKRVK